MSTPAAALARRAVACKGWRWMHRMCTIPRDYMLDGRRFVAPAKDIGNHSADPDDLPDLSDPATLGCFEHGLLPEAGYTDAHLDACAGRDGETLWFVAYRPDPVSFPNKWLSASEDGVPTKAEALVAALESAPS